MVFGKKSIGGGSHLSLAQSPEDKLDEFDGLLIRGDKNPNTQGAFKGF